MKTLKEETKFNCSANELWLILSDVGRCDWVPTIDKITLEGDFRHFEMTGMGQITEKILKQDDASMTLQYSAIKTPAPIEHHLATMQIASLNEQECMLSWTTEISPDIFADGIHQGMLISIDGIKKVI
ncbi:MAG: SRPBCC family protein [Gammaproteobacteria bacterium]|nr:MAG: SRPBCC family protein [Gammaproteobacteria bacterium TMED236]|tara:strand:- start:1552 stop:1935 length:384 start_codon:yes stop_codon:yes gene_type:complete